MKRRGTSGAMPLATMEETVVLILQFLKDEKYGESAHKLERESGVYFDWTYFESCVTKGDWEDAEWYLSGFTNVEDNEVSTKIYFEMRKQKYLEALDQHDHVKAVDILSNELKVFSTRNEALYKELTLLLNLKDFRENKELSSYWMEVESARRFLCGELKKLIRANPVLRDKLQFPTLRNSELKMLINLSLNWQHQLCGNPKPKPDIKTILVDQNCGMPNDAHGALPITNPLLGSIPKVGGLPPQGAPSLASGGTPFARWMTNPLSLANQTAAGGHTGLTVLNNTASGGHTGLTVLNKTDSESSLKRLKPLRGKDEGASMFTNALPGIFRVHAEYLSDDLPKNVIVNINEGSAVNSMDFHPVQQTLLLVGTNSGDITIWEVGSRERLVSQKFILWDVHNWSMNLQAAMAKNFTVSVNRVIWSPNGAHLGVAYSKNIVHVYSYHGGCDLRNHLEIDAHIGNVGDIAFSHPKDRFCIITCGDDKMIKVWDCVTGAKHFTFEGHAAPIFSVCPHQKDGVQFFFSTSVDGKIKAWLYDNVDPIVDYDAPGCSRIRMAYSSDETRLFSCGTNKEGVSYIMEWNEQEGSVKRIYEGLGKNNAGVVQFDTTRNRILAASDEFQIKFWDMENVNLLMATNVDGGLPATPCIRFNKEGMLLAVSTNENGVKVLANSDGAHLLQSIQSRAEASRAASAAVSKGPLIGSSTNVMAAGVGEGNGAMVCAVLRNRVGQNQQNGLPGFAVESEKAEIWKLSEIVESSELRSLRLPDGLLPSKVARIGYTNAGIGILALACNAVHKLWKWPRNDQIGCRKSTSSVAPQLDQASSGMLMTNDICQMNIENAVPCFALSKNDAYAVSASGGKISLYNMLKFKPMTTFMAPPPAATSIAFNPKDNNILVVGMDDSYIRIYDVKFDKVTSTLKGHQNRVTGLTFSDVLNVLVSSGADAQLCIWSIDGWSKQASKFLKISACHEPTPVFDTRVHFHRDQIHVLAVHETQLAIYEAPDLDCQKQWIPQSASGSILDAVYSCDGQSIYACLKDGSIAVITATTLRQTCRINPAAYVSSYASSRAHPLVIAAHPTESNQIAVGLTDGGVYVLEPLESEGRWGASPSLEIDAGPGDDQTM